MAIKGIFKPVNKDKYNGRKGDVIFRSLWERKVMSYLDMHPDVVTWSSESVVVPYVSPVDRKRHRYFPDFLVTMRNSDGILCTQMWEVKPLAQTRPPKPTQIRGRPTKRYITEAVTYAINEAKWDSAKKYCEAKGWDFVLLTEKNIFG